MRLGVLASAFAAAGLLGGCLGGPSEPPLLRPPSAAGVPLPGWVIRLEPIETRDRAALQRVADDLPGDIQVRNDADLFRLVYWTEFKGRSVPVSGLIAVPRGVQPRGVVVYLHGTTTTRAVAPSLPGRADGDQEAAVFAGSGFITLLPDYVGLGESDLPQAYLVTQPQVDAAVDMLKAIRGVGGLPGLPERLPLFLMGFSQGGQSAAGLHRALERNPEPGYDLAATVAIAGPHDLLGAVTGKLEAPEAESPRNVAYLAFAATAYAAYYDQRLDTLLTAELARTVPGLFDGSHSPEEIVGGLPSDTRALFRPEALAALKAGDGWFARALTDNETARWTPRAPLRIVIGEADEDVPPASSRALLEQARPGGGSTVSLELVPDADHMGAAAHSYAPTLAWFESLAGGS